MPHPQACPDESTLLGFLRDQLDGTDACRIDDHIGGCPACQRAAWTACSEACLVCGSRRTNDAQEDAHGRSSLQ